MRRGKQLCFANFKKFGTSDYEHFRKGLQEGLYDKGFSEMTKNNFVLLRMVKKVKKADEKTMKKGLDTAFLVELDKEEYKLFVDIVGIQEG